MDAKLKKLVKKYIKAKKAADEENGKWQAALAEIEPLRERLDALRDALLEAETPLRERLVQIYEDTGDKAIGPMLGVRVRTAFELGENVSEEELVEWTMKWAPLCLHVDLRKLERLCEAGVLPERIGRQVEIPVATLGKDLAYSEAIQEVL